VSQSESDPPPHAIFTYKRSTVVFPSKNTHVARFFIVDNEMRKAGHAAIIFSSADPHPAHRRRQEEEKEGRKAKGRVNTTGFPEEFRSRENPGDLRGMHLRRYSGNVTSRCRHRIVRQWPLDVSVLPLQPTRTNIALL